MANIKKLKENGQDIVPITHEQAVLDSNGVTLDSKLNAINNAISRLENNSTSGTPSNPSLGGNTTIITMGNYTIKYNETDDTLDFIYNDGTGGGTPEEPTTGGISLSWIDNRNLDYKGVENDDTSAMVTDYLTKEDGYNYTVNLTSVSSVKIYFFNSSKTFISRTDNLTVDSTDILIEFPENTSYFRIKSDKGTATVDNANDYIILKKDKSDVPSTPEEPGTGGTTQEEVIPSWNDNKSLDSAGNITNNTECILSDLIKIDSNYNYTINYNANVLNLRIASYNSSQTFISRTEYLTSGNVDTIITFPENAGYFRVKADKGSSTVNEANDNIIIKKVKKVGGYVTEGLSMYIDANDVATYGSVRDITGNYYVTNHGVSTTLDNGCLNFVSTESDYIDCGFVPNLTTWSTEVYFYFTNSTPVDSQNIYCFGNSSSNRVRVGYSNSEACMQMLINSNRNNIGNIDSFLRLRHMVITANNGTYTVYVDGIQQYTFSGGTLNSHTNNMIIGTSSYSTGNFADMNLKTFRHYDGKALTPEEVLQNYNYEKNRNVIKPTWKTNMKLDDTGMEITSEDNACSDFIPYDSSYDYTLAIDTVVFFRVFTYDSSKAFISKISIEDNFNGVITPPSNTAYIRLKLGTNNMAVPYSELDNHVVLKKVHK